MRSRSNRSGAARIVTAVACGLTAIGYSSFVFAAWAHSRLPATRSYVSELEAVGQPDRGLFRLSDVLCGIGLIVIGILAGRLLPRLRAAAVGCALLAVAGVSSLLDAANPMNCAPSIDAVCRARQDTASGLLDQVTQAHTTSSLAGFVGTAAAMLLLGTAGTATTSGFRRLSIAAGLATATLGLVDVVLILTHSVVGISERARILVFSLWLLALGVRVLGGGRARAGSTRRHLSTRYHHGRVVTVRK